MNSAKDGDAQAWAHRGACAADGQSAPAVAPVGQCSAKHTTQEHRNSGTKVKKLTESGKRRQTADDGAAWAMFSPDIPGSIGEWEARVFRICRRIAATPEVKDRDTDYFRAALERWHIEAGAAAPADVEEVWGRFEDSIDDVRFPLNDGGVGQLLKLEIEAMHRSGVATDSKYRPSTDTYRVLEACHAMSRIAGGDRFYLSCRDAGDAVGIDHVRASRSLRVLVRDGRLSIVPPEHGGARGCFDAITYQMQPGENR